MGTGISGWGEERPLASAEQPEHPWQARGGEKGVREAVNNNQDK